MTSRLVYGRCQSCDCYSMVESGSRLCFVCYVEVYK